MLKPCDTATERDRLSVELQNVSHRYGSRAVFEDVNASIYAGQICTLSGGNGAGKSTLLRIIAGLLSPIEGSASILIDGRNLNAQERRSAIGYAAPDMALYRELTAAENLLFFGKLRGLHLSKDDLIALLTRVGLRGRGRDTVGSFSSGMRQRLKLAFATLGQPPILLLDEPTANLDRDGVAIVEQLVSAQRMRPAGGLTIIATNDPGEVEWGDIQIRLKPVNSL